MKLAYGRSLFVILTSYRFAKIFFRHQILHKSNHPSTAHEKATSALLMKRRPPPLRVRRFGGIGVGLVSISVVMVRRSELSGWLFLFYFHSQVIAAIFELKATSGSIDVSAIGYTSQSLCFELSASLLRRLPEPIVWSCFKP